MLGIQPSRMHWQVILPTVPSQPARRRLSLVLNGRRCAMLWDGNIRMTLLIAQILEHTPCYLVWAEVHASVHGDDWRKLPKVELAFPLARGDAAQTETTTDSSPPNPVWRPMVGAQGLELMAVPPAVGLLCTAPGFESAAQGSGFQICSRTRQKSQS